jgi:hypothetical protein
MADVFPVPNLPLIQRLRRARAAQAIPARKRNAGTVELLDLLR